MWNSKPFDVQEQDIAKFSQDVASLIDYIKELTKENANLHASCTEFERKCASLNDECAKVRADTVREMAKRLKGCREKVDCLTFRLVSFDTIDKIKEEMINEKNPDTI